ncbi:hypothetical protein INT46_000958 [Mucor plumbeus]|uniref:Uncharacterized protein n=1 Tax=Mucor plumbeus TaxID=97098 RepID=A0A8H7RG59_9FUNG|nr:hypothetical protein INT46_000958 [Mucor plumbeus]
MQKKIKIGVRTGVGAQSGFCRQCENCLLHYGGYTVKRCGNYRFVFKIPDGLSSEVTANFFCVGVTTYAPLKHTSANSQCVIGVIGIISPMALLMNQDFIHGFAIGKPKEIKEMLVFAVEKNVRPWITTYPISEVIKTLENFRE